MPKKRTVCLKPLRHRKAGSKSKTMKEIGLRHLDTVSYLDGGTKKQPHTLIAYWMREREREREREWVYFLGTFMKDCCLKCFI